MSTSKNKDDERVGKTSQLLEETDIVGSENEDLFLKYPKRIISASITSELPFSSTIAFDAFSDLPRQPSWAPWLKSVVYLDEIVDNAKTPSKIKHNGLPLRETEWTLRMKGIDFSWRAISTQLERPNLIQWESTSGIRNKGRVQFLEKQDGNCDMMITMSFVMPRVLVKLFQKSTFVKKFFEEKMLGGMLDRFRYKVLKEDLGIDTEEIQNDFDENNLVS